MKPIRTAHHFAILTLPGLMSCGSKPAPVVEAPQTRRAEPTQEIATIGVSSEVGALNEDAVNHVFETAQNALLGCVRKGANRVELLSGDIAIFIGINGNGRAADARVERSTLGDRDTEVCMLQVLRGRAWPKPVGGRKGQVQNHSPLTCRMTHGRLLNGQLTTLRKHSKSCTNIWRNAQGMATELTR